MTTISLDAQATIFAQESGDYEILLLTLSSDELDDDFLLSTDWTERLVSLTTDEQVVYGTVSNSLDYIYCPMSISWPSDDEDAPPQTTLTIDSIPHEMTAIIRSLLHTPSLSMALVLASAPDTVEKQISGLAFKDVTISGDTLTASLMLDVMTNESFPYRKFTPSTASGLYSS